MADEQTADQKAEQLARLAADRAAKLALVDADKATELAVRRAVKDANVDRDLAEHAKRLKDINSSQRTMAIALEGVQKALESLVTADEAQAKFRKEISERTGHSWSVRAAIFTGLGVIAAYGTLVYLFLTH